MIEFVVAIIENSTHDNKDSIIANNDSNNNRNNNNSKFNGNNRNKNCNRSNRIEKIVLTIQ